MTKRLTLLALTLVAGSALAQSPNSNVTIYGLIDIGVSRVTGLRGGTDDGVVSGIMEGSRLGFKGSEDIGGGYRALFTIEQRIEADTGTLSNRPPSGGQLPDRVSFAPQLGLPAALQPAVSAVAAQLGNTVGVNLNNAAWDRQAYVGLVTPFGGFLAGRQYTPAYEVAATFDVMGTQSSLASGQISALPPSVEIRASNALAYRIQQGPLSASVMYAFGEVSGSTKANRLLGAQAIYKTDAYGVGLGYNRRNNESGQTALKSLVVGAYAALGPGALYGSFATVKDDNPASLSTIAAALTPQLGAATAGAVQAAFVDAFRQDAHQYQVGYKLTSGPHTVYVAYNKLNDRRPANADVASYGAVYTYALSKRTDLNFVLTHFDNSANAQAAPGQAGFIGGVTGSAGKDSNNIAAGIRHRF